MNRLSRFRVLLCSFGLVALSCCWSNAYAACSVPNILSNGQTANATAVNENFNALASCIDSTYATGTWTPSIFDGSTLGIGYSEQVGFFSKICASGHLCTVFARFRIVVSGVSNPGSSNQGLFIAGLPFNIASSSAGAYQHLSLERLKGITGITDGATGQVYGAAFVANRTVFFLLSDQASVVANSVTASTVLEGELICTPTKARVGNGIIGLAIACVCIVSGAGSLNK